MFRPSSSNTAECNLMNLNGENHLPPYQPQIQQQQQPVTPSQSQAMSSVVPVTETDYHLQRRDTNASMYSHILTSSTHIPSQSVNSSSMNNSGNQSIFPNFNSTTSQMSHVSYSQQLSPQQTAQTQSQNTSIAPSKSLNRPNKVHLTTVTSAQNTWNVRNVIFHLH